MSETTALTTTGAGNGVAVSRPAPVAVSSAGATVKSIEAILRPAGARDLIPDGPLAGYSKTMVDAVTSSVAKGAPPAELYRFFVQAIRYNLDPMAREIWCINTAGKDQAPQWQVTPSRDGYRRAARRNPTVADIRSGLVRDGDDFTYDGDAGTYSHKVKISAKKGAILGAYCQIVMADGRKHVEFFYMDEVKRGTPVWQQFPDRMVVAAAERTMIKRHVGMSDLYVDDAVFDKVDEYETALLVDPSTKNVEYVDGFAVGIAPPQLVAAPVEQSPENGRGNRNEAVKALNTLIKMIQESVDGSTWGDALDARTDWLKSRNLPLIANIGDAEAVWDLVDVLQGEEGAEEFSNAVTAARDARWTKEAIAKELAEAGGQPVTQAAIDTTATQVAPPQHVFVSSMDDDTPDALAEGEEL